MKPHRNLFRTLLGLVVAALFVFFAFRGISLKALLSDALEANFYILIVTVLVVLFSHFLRALRWRVILQELKRDISVADTWGSIMVGYMVNNFVPRLGEVVRAYTTGSLEEVRVSGVLGTIVLERLFDMVSAGALFGLALFVYHGNLIESFPFLRVAGAILIAGSILAGSFFYVASVSEKFKRITMRIVDFLLPKNIAGKAESVILSFLESFGLLRSGRSITVVLLYTGLIWVVYIFSMYIPFFAFSFGSALHLTFYDAFLLILVTAFAWIVPSPGGVGVYQFFVSQALVVISHVPRPEALAYATLTQLLGYIAITIVGAIFALIFTRRLRLKSFAKLIKTEVENAHDQPR